MKTPKILLLAAAILLVTQRCHADQFWDDACLKREKASCGTRTLHIKDDKPMTEEDKKVFICRLRALAKCRKKVSNDS